jgi:hypothetical protein
MKNIKLQKGFATSILDENINEHCIDVNIHMLHTGSFTDMNGTDVEVTKETLGKLRDTYNKMTREAYLIDKELSPTVALQDIEQYDNRNAPNQVNHSTWDAWDTVGNVIGLFDVQELSGKYYLLGKVRVKGEDNVRRVKDGRWRNVSIQYNPETYEFVEISWVTFGAAGDARHLMSMPHLNIASNQMLHHFQDTIATIQQKQNEIAILDKEIAVTQKLMALIHKGSITRAQMLDLKPKLLQNDNPKEVISLIENVLPDNKFKPYLIRNKQVIAMLQKETIMASTVEDRVQFSDTLEALKASIALKKSKKKLSDDKGIEDDYISDDVDLSDVEDKDAKKLADGEDVEDSDDVEKLKAKKNKLEKEHDMELSKLREEINVKFAKFSEQSAADMKMVTDAFVSLAELIKGSK